MLRRLVQLCRSLMPTANIAIGKGSRVKRRRVSLDPGCRLVVGRQSIVDARIIADRPGAEFIVGKRTSLGNSLLVADHRIEIEDDVLRPDERREGKASVRA